MALEFFRALETHARNTPDHPAILDGPHCLTYRQLHSQVEQFAGALDTLNPDPDDTMGIFCLNQKEYIIALLGALLKGIPVVPFNALLTPEDLAYIAGDAGITHLVLNPMFVKPETVPLFTKFKTRILTGDSMPPSLPETGTVTFEAFLQSGDSASAHRRHARNEAFSDVIMYTSGTTARPKGVMLDETAFYANATGVLAHLQFVPEDRAIMALPLFHSFGNIIALLVVLTGATIILLPQFQPKAILSAVEEHQATILPLVPTIYSFLVQLYERGGYDVSSLKYCISGGAALPHVILKRVEETLGVTVLEGYGLTETAPVIAVNTMAQGSVVGSVGPVLPNVQVKLVDDSGNPVAQGEVGEILVRGPSLMRGYWNQPNATRDTLTSDGWLKTGDLGHLDAQGRLFISAGRKKDLIIRAGENVSPLAIENTLMNHPGVLECAAVGLPHERLGEQVVACVVPRDGQTLEIQALRDHCREKLPAFMVPDQFEVRDSLPKNTIGKIAKSQLRDELQNR